MKKARIVSNAARVRVPDIDALPFPDREAIDHGLYLDAWKTHHGASSINLITARGCAYKCNWCSHAVYGHSHRRRSPANVADEMQWIIDRYDPDQVWYADDVFTISHPWLASYTAELKRRGIHRPFETITRADRLQNEGAAALLRELGCYRIWIGSESGSQKILDAMQRGVKVEQVRHACRLAHAQGIEVGMFLMWGYEGEEIEDIAATVEHVKQSNPDVFFTTVSYPIKGTGYYDKVRERVELPIAWAEASDRDYVIAGRHGKDYYKLADAWLRNEVEAFRVEAADPARAAELLLAAQARARILERVGKSAVSAAHRPARRSTVIERALRATTERLAREIVQPVRATTGVERIRMGQWLAPSAPCMDSPRCSRTGCVARPASSWSSFLIEQRDHSRAHYERAGEILARIDAAARDAGIRCIALKGSALRALALHQPGERPMGDIDLLVAPRDLPACASMLCEDRI